MKDKTPTERAAEIDNQIMRLQERKKRLLNRQKEEERKERTHRLISCGAVLESAFGMKLDPDALAAYLGVTVRYDENGNKVSVAEIQRQYYMQTIKRLSDEKRNAESPC